MIYTVTFNPPLDYIVSVNNFQMGKTNRTAEERLLAGGKGINVSTVLHNLGLESTAFYYSAGFVGDEITRRLQESGIGACAIPVETGVSRINVKIKNVDGTEINGMGPDIRSEDIEVLLHRLDALTEGDILVLAGSIPQSMPDTIYSDIMERLGGRGVRIVVDATGRLLLNVLQYRPFLIKPNHHELGELYGVTITTREEVVPYARRLQEQGAANVLVSMSSKGAVLLAEDGQVYMSEAPEGTLVNAVGAGDSMVAGFLAGYLETEDLLQQKITDDKKLEHAFHMGLATGSASAFSEFLATKEEILQVYHAFI